MADLQSIEELLESAERKQKGETKQATPDRNGSARLDHDADFVPLNDSRDRGQRDGKRGGDRYTPGGRT
jgi:hypothetical protein